MFIYTENDTESDTRNKTNNFKYKTHQQYTNTFPQNSKIEKHRKIQKYFYHISVSITYILYTWYISYILYILYLYIYSDVIPFRGMLQRRKGTI